LAAQHPSGRLRKSNRTPFRAPSSCLSRHPPHASPGRIPHENVLIPTRRGQQVAVTTEGHGRDVAATVTVTVAPAVTHGLLLTRGHVPLPRHFPAGRGQRLAIPAERQAVDPRAGRTIAVLVLPRRPHLDGQPLLF